MITKHKEIWFDARELPDDKLQALLPPLAHNGIDVCLAKIEQLKKLDVNGSLHWAVELDGEDDLSRIPESIKPIIFSTDLTALSRAKSEGCRVAYFHVVADEPSLQKGLREGANADYCIVQLRDETNIPVELFAATFQNLPQERPLVLKHVRTAEEGRIACGVVENGADGFLISTTDVSELVRSGKFKEEQKKGKIILTPAVVEEVTHLGMGQRTCVDTVVVMGKNEGMIVGCTSSGGILACAEVHPLPYMDLRPFRVNAGAIHSYIWLPNNRTGYLSELKAGDQVLCVTTDGTTRPAYVGRAKVETRPLILIHAKANETPILSILQDDWHVRLFGGKGEVCNVTSLKRGDQILAYIAKPGRHVGIPVEEWIDEK